MNTPESESILPGATLRQTLHQLWRITKAFFASERRAKARGLLAILLLLALASVGGMLIVSYAARDVITAISNKDWTSFWTSMGRYSGMLAVSVFIDVYSRLTQQRLALVWREWISQHLIKRYFNNRAYYRLRGSENIDNPDQRISEDVRNFTLDSLSYVLIALDAVMTLIGFLGVLWSISGMLLSVAVVYALFGTVMCFIIARRLVPLNYEKYQKEADFRYGLVRVRDNAESIAFYRGEKREHLDLVNRLSAIVRNMLTIIRWNRNLGFFRNSYNSAAVLLPILLVAPLYMRGEIEFGVVTQSLDAFARVLGAVSIVAIHFEGLSIYLAGVQRLGSLWDDLDQFDAEEERVAREGKETLDKQARVVKLHRFTVHTPDGARVLARELTFEVKQGQGLMIMGESGTGKSSVLRTIAGLWPGGPGTMERPTLVHLMFLPQRPYMVNGTLRDQLQYPHAESGLDDGRIREVMARVNLGEVLQRVDGDLDRVIDWTNVLSLGEQQRVAFARLFLKPPWFAFLDEATSALDEDNERQLYDLIRESGIGFISVGHRTSLIAYHEHILRLQRDGAWRMENVGPTWPSPAGASGMHFVTAAGDRDDSSEDRPPTPQTPMLPA